MRNLWRHVKRDKYLLLLLLPGIAYFVVFQYLPLYGVVIAFKEFSVGKGILGSPWVNPLFRYFNQFFRSYYFGRLIRNTFLISVYSLAWGFPVPIIFALALNELKPGAFKKTIQTISYMPHFISTVVVAGLLINFLSPSNGLINNIITNFGGKKISFLQNTSWFRGIYVGSGVWQGFGWGSIIYLAALSGIDPQLYEAATIDGAGRWKQMWHVSLPGISNTVIILLIMNMGNLLRVGYEKLILLYSASVYEVADVISTYVYRSGLLDKQYSFASAVGLFNSVVSLVLLTTFNRLSKKVSEVSIW